MSEEEKREIHEAIQKRYKEEEIEHDGRTIFADPGYFNQSKERADEDCERG